MENIIVTSGGFNTINNYVSKENIELFKELSKGKKVLIIANAAPAGSGNYIARENVKDNFLKAGALQADIKDLDKNNVDSILDYDVIYGLGGNLQYLVELNENTNFKELLTKFLRKGVYIGESAGSMILADNVKWVYDIKKGTKPKYDVELKSYNGLGLIDYYIYPHYQKANDFMQKKIDNYEKNNNIRITRLNDGDIMQLEFTI